VSNADLSHDEKIVVLRNWKHELEQLAGERFDADRTASIASKWNPASLLSTTR
jgi:hypothetical protein